jgi:hypothetical protein
VPLAGAERVGKGTTQLTVFVAVPLFVVAT